MVANSTTLKHAKEPAGIGGSWTGYGHNQTACRRCEDRRLERNSRA